MAEEEKNIEAKAAHQHAHHHRRHGHTHAHGASGNIAIAFVLNLAFAIFEFVGGFFVNSIAIVSDAVHDLGDALVIGTSLVLEKKSGKAPDSSYSYGYRRYSTLGALLTTCVLIAGAVLVVVNAVPRIIEPEEANYAGMMAFAVFGIIVNGVAAWRTSGDGSLNQRAVNLHMLEDVLGWVAVLVGAIVMYFTGWAVIDPIMSIGIACFIGYNAVRNLRDALPIFLEKVPGHVEIDDLPGMLVDVIDGLEDVHHLHVWSLDEDVVVATMHAVVSEKHSSAEVKTEIKHRLGHLGIAHSTIEIEVPGEDCGEQGRLCSPLSAASCEHREHVHD